MSEYYKEGSHLVKRVVKLPRAGSTTYLYTIIGEKMSIFYRWLPDKTWEEIDLSSAMEGNTFLEEGTDITITGSGTSLNPYIITYSGSGDGSETNIQQGTNVTVTGVGTSVDPYIISSTDTISDGSETVVQGSGDIAVTGVGTVGDPYIVDYNASISVPILRYVKVTITTAQLLTLHTTPIEIIPAPGAGKAIELFTAAGRVVFNTSAYHVNDEVYLTHSSNTALEAQYRFFQTGMSQTFDVFQQFIRKIEAGEQIKENEAIVAKENNGAAITLGDSDMVIYATYRIIDL